MRNVGLPEKGSPWTRGHEEGGVGPVDRDPVEANFKQGGTWYKGKVGKSYEEKGRTLYDIEYDDGDSEQRVELSNLRPPTDFFKGNLWLLEGSPLMHQFEATLTSAFGDYKSSGSTQIIGLMSYLMNRL